MDMSPLTAPPPETLFFYILFWGAVFVALMFVAAEMVERARMLLRRRTALRARAKRRHKGPVVKYTFEVTGADEVTEAFESIERRVRGSSASAFRPPPRRTKGKS